MAATVFTRKINKTPMDENWLDSEKTLGKKVLRIGNGLKCPREFSKCEVLIKQVSGPLAEKQEFLFNEPCSIIASDCDSPIGRGLEKILLTLKKEEICLITMKIRKIELEEGISIKTVAKDEFVEFQFYLELISFEPQPEIYELDDQTKIDHAKRHKEKGVELYRSSLVFSAFYRFSKALKLLIFTINPSTAQTRNELTVACYLNIAQCQLRTMRFEFVVRNCGKVLELDGKNTKAYYRRGVAFLNLQEYEKAREDFKKVSELEPGNCEVEKQLILLSKREKDDNQLLAKRMQNFFK